VESPEKTLEIKVPLREAERNGVVVEASRVPVGFTPGGGGKTNPPGPNGAGTAWAIMMLQKIAESARKPRKPSIL